MCPAAPHTLLSPCARGYFNIYCPPTSLPSRCVQWHRVRAMCTESGSFRFEDVRTKPDKNKMVGNEFEKKKLETCRWALSNHLRRFHLILWTRANNIFLYDLPKLKMEWKKICVDIRWYCEHQQQFERHMRNCQVTNVFFRWHLRHSHKQFHDIKKIKQAELLFLQFKY